MRKSFGLAQTSKGTGQNQPAESLDLEFPIAPDFCSRPPRLDPQVMLKRCAETMPWRNSRPGEKARRSAEQIDVEFVL